MTYHSTISESLARLEILTNEKWILITYQPPNPPVELTTTEEILLFYQEHTPEPILISYNNLESLCRRYLIDRKVAYLYFPTLDRQRELENFLANFTKGS